MNQTKLRLSRRPWLFFLGLILFGSFLGSTSRSWAQAPECLYSATEESVTDKKTGLIWQRRVGVDYISWEQATAECDNLAAKEGLPWRLPTIRELETLADEDHSYPILDDCLFPDTPNLAFWSSTIYAKDTKVAWAFGVLDAQAAPHPQGATLNLGVRCVR